MAVVIAAAVSGLLVGMGPAWWAAGMLGLAPLAVLVSDALLLGYRRRG